jgi:hypothetical protein
MMQVPLYASYLYDAVMIYAQALDKVIKDKQSIRDGKNIINKIIGHSFRSKSLRMS